MFVPQTPDAQIAAYVARTLKGNNEFKKAVLALLLSRSDEESLSVPIWISARSSGSEKGSSDFFTTPFFCAIQPKTSLPFCRPLRFSCCPLTV